MHDSKMIADAYLALWNEAGDDARRAALETGWTANARYIDPVMRGEGRDGIAAMIGAARAQFPGHRFTLRGTPDGHDAFVRFSWTLAPEGGSAIAAGTDIVRSMDRERSPKSSAFSREPANDRTIRHDC